MKTTIYMHHKILLYTSAGASNKTAHLPEKYEAESFVNNKLSLIKPKYYFMFATRPLYMYNIQTVEPRYSETLANNKVVDTAKFFTPVRAKCKKENLDITKPHFIEHIL